MNQTAAQEIFSNKRKTFTFAQLVELAGEAGYMVENDHAGLGNQWGVSVDGKLVSEGFATERDALDWGIANITRTTFVVVCGNGVYRSIGAGCSPRHHICIRIHDGYSMIFVATANGKFKLHTYSR